MARNYSRSLDYEIDYITVGSLQKDDIGDKIYIHDNANDVVRWQSVAIYEDMFSNFMSCEIAIFDQDGLFLNRLRTDEAIVIRFKTPNLVTKTFEARKHYFYLYKIDSIAITSKPPGAFYVLKGISFEYFYNSLRTFSRSYTGKTNEIAKKIYDEYLDAKNQRTITKKFTMGRDTRHEMKFSFPYVNPVDAINHLASVSIDSTNKDICNFVFFENKDGFNFISITELIENPRKTHKYKTSRLMEKSFLLFDEYFYDTIKVTPRKTGDKIIDTLDGVHGEYFADFDLLYKEYTPYINPSVNGSARYWGKRYLDYFPKTKHLNRVPMLAPDNTLFKYPLGRNRICFTSNALYAEKQQTVRGRPEEWKMYKTHEEEYSFQRRSMMQQINAFTIEVTVPGNSDLTVGDIIDFDTVIYRTSDKDKYLTGKYIITAVNHLFTLDEYKSIMTLSRDSLTSDDFDDNSDAGE
jgi:hypothetical protein